MRKRMDEENKQYLRNQMKEKEQKSETTRINAMNRDYEQLSTVCQQYDSAEHEKKE